MLRTLLIGSVAAYLGVCLLVWVNQRRLLYFPARGARGTPAEIGWAYESVRLRAGDGTQVEAWWIPPPGPPRGAVLFLHGNGGSLPMWYPVAAAFRERGLATLLLDYRGYGRSEGTPTETGLYQDAEAAWRHLVGERDLQPDRVVLVGRSLGGAVAAHLAERHPDAAALVLESTFTSVPDLAAGLYPWLPVRWLARDRYPTLDRLPRVRVPLLIVHSGEDELIPFAHAQRLYGAANPPRRLVRIRGDHNDGFHQSEAEHRAALAELLAPLGL